MGEAMEKEDEVGIFFCLVCQRGMRRLVADW